MKKIFQILLAAMLVTLTSCSDKEEKPAGYYDEKLSGHWYAETPAQGITENWRTEEEGDSVAYDHVGIIVYFNPESKTGYWCYIFIKDGEMVNVAGFGKSGVEQDESYFNYTVDNDGNIDISKFLKGVDHLGDIYYYNDMIVANANDQTLVFRRPAAAGKEDFLEEIWEIVAESGMGGFDDGGTKIDTDVTDENAYEPSRARRR